VCKDVWICVFDKQMYVASCLCCNVPLGSLFFFRRDNLRTNHRGVFVLQDSGFKPVLRLSGPSAEPNTQPEVSKMARSVSNSGKSLISGSAQP
jgi:hypothetical protein